MKAKNFLAIVQGLSQAINSFITEFVEEFPNFLDDLAAGYRTSANPEIGACKERLLKGFVQKDKIIFGKNSVYRAHGLASLARFYKESYRYADAEKYYKQAAQLLIAEAEQRQEATYGFREYLSEYVSLLSLYAKTKDAEIYQKELLRFSTQESKKERAADLAGLALLCLKNGNDAEANEHLDESINMMLEACGPCSKELLEFMEDWHFKLRHSSPGAEQTICKLSEHLRLLDDLLILEKALGQDHRALIPALEALSAYHKAAGRQELCHGLDLSREIAFLANKLKQALPYPALARDLNKLAGLYETRNQGGDKTVAFHLRKRAEQLSNKKSRF